jgi:hypothetical protein
MLIERVNVLLDVLLVEDGEPLTVRAEGST